MTSRALPVPMPRAQVLSILPDDVPVADVLPWLDAAQRYALESRRGLAVARALRRAENLAALDEAVRVRQQRLLVSSERACSLCHKRLGGAVLVSYPGGLLAHYLCHKRHAGGAGVSAGSLAGGQGGAAGGGDGGVVAVG
jgi:hypothetical protein